MQKWLSISLLLLSAALLHGQWTQAPAYPQTSQGPYPQSQYSQDDPPGLEEEQQNQSLSSPPDPADLQHGVARISIAQGDVNVQRGDNGQLTGAVINAPVVAHDHLQTSSGSRAEVQLDAATLLRLAPESDIGFADLQYHRAQIQLVLGTIIFRVLPNAATQVEIDTPSVGIRALTLGEYRISVFDNGTSQITVRSGQLEISGPRGSERIGAGHSLMVRGDASNPEMQYVAEIPGDQFDQWSQGLPSEMPAPQSYQYVNSDVQGAADLDRYGSWVPSGYGQVWHPQGVAADWAPYSDGQWSYVDYYGWSWIDYSPWGWAPYHYGRWFFNSGYGWCWWPGSRSYPAYWSPALVGFFGFGRGLGWVALAPYERYHRWWGRGLEGNRFGYRDGYGRTGYGLASYRNAAFRGGALTASFNSFGAGHQRFGIAGRDELRSASIIDGRLPVSASRASFNYSNRSVVQSSRFTSAQSRGFFQGNLSSRPGAASPSVANRSSYPSPANGRGWQSFGVPGASATRQNFQGSETSGWHNFGQTQNRYQTGPRYSDQQSEQRSYRQPSYQQPMPRTYSEPRYQQPMPRTYSEPRYQQPAPRSYSQPNYQQPRYNAPAPRESQPHYNSAPSPSRGGGGSSGGHSQSGGSGGGHRGR